MVETRMEEASCVARYIYIMFVYLICGYKKKAHSTRTVFVYSSSYAHFAIQIERALYSCLHFFLLSSKRLLIHHTSPCNIIQYYIYSTAQYNLLPFVRLLRHDIICYLLRKNIPTINHHNNKKNGDINE